MSSLVNNLAVADAELLVPKPVLARVYVWPFGIIYSAFVHIYLNHYDKYLGGSEWTFVYLMTVGLMNMLLWLMPHWNLNIDMKFNYDKVDSLSQASHIKITPAANSGIGDICVIQRETFQDGANQISFLYQKRRHLYVDSKKYFSPPHFHVDDLPQMSFFQNNTGLSGDLEKTKRIYGLNRFDIPVPTFLELFKEHAVAPFFVFQIFCVALWCMDEQWYYSLFSLFMLVSFEMTTVFQRRATMTEFQSMGIKPYDIYVYRDKKWSQTTTDQLLSGDIVSVTRTKDESAVPCDLVLLDGTAIMNEAMLSGESTPLLKESVKLRPAKDYFQPEGMDKNSLLHGGTVALQVTAPQNSVVPVAPDNGALAYVSKTGFETSQGSLVRMMIFSSERVSVDNKEAFLFILFLLVFAIAASWYVWVEGTRMGRIQSKLILDCIIVITSVVPPELPMELTLAVNLSLLLLQKHYIYCTEPFRIPLAGRIDVCCFDKTGTLTAEDLVFEGLAGLNSLNIDELITCNQAPVTTSHVLGSAHALVKLDDGDIVGDPMEQATLKAAAWTVGANGTVERSLESVNQKEKITILRRFQFSSALKRSLTITSINTVKGKNFVAVKGAPETIRSMLVDVPAHYEECYKLFTLAGSRVLALGYKYINSSQNVTKLERNSVECDLSFAGFIVFHCPLKQDAIDTIQMLNDSSHRSIMITGDNPLTACHVAREVGITTKEVLIFDAPEEHHNFGDEYDIVVRNVSESFVEAFDGARDVDPSWFRQYDFCVTGHALTHLSEHPQLKKLLKHSWVYARVSPAQKEFLLASFKDLGYNTLMCGDGTNDVGALKQAHIGVALLNGTEEVMNKIAENRRIETMQTVYYKQAKIMADWLRPPPPVPALIAHLYPPGKYNPHYITAMEKKGIEITSQIRQLVEKAIRDETLPIAFVKDESGQINNMVNITESLMSRVGDDADEEVPTLKLGDASVAAPFTSKLANVSAVTKIIRQGRCALVSTIQMYKILALNCLISAYSLSVLYLAGIKFGDGQSTVSGVLLSVCFFSVSRGKPLEKLSKERPASGIFNVYIMGSILGQFAVHIVTLIYITSEIYKLEPRVAQVDLEKKFVPSLLNTGMFLLQLAQQVSTFAVNYIGLPFKEGIRDNKGMYYGLLGVAGLALIGSTEFMPELNQAMRFVPMTTDFKAKLTGSILVDLSFTWVIEVVMKHFFMNSGASDIAER